MRQRRPDLRRPGKDAPGGSGLAWKLVLAVIAVMAVTASCSGDQPGVEPWSVVESPWNDTGMPLETGLGVHLGSGPEVVDAAGVSTYGELSLENWTDAPIQVLSIEPIVRGGAIMIDDIRVLDDTRDLALFDFMPGPAHILFPDSVPLDQHVFEPIGDFRDDSNRMLGDEILISFRNTSTSEDLYVYGFTIRYQIGGGDTRTLEAKQHAFVSCLESTSETACGVTELESFKTELGTED